MKTIDSMTVEQALHFLTPTMADALLNGLERLGPHAAKSISLRDALQAANRAALERLRAELIRIGQSPNCHKITDVFDGLNVRTGLLEEFDAAVYRQWCEVNVLGVTHDCPLCEGSE